MSCQSAFLLNTDAKHAQKCKIHLDRGDATVTFATTYNHVQMHPVGEVFRLSVYRTPCPDTTRAITSMF